MVGTWSPLGLPAFQATLLLVGLLTGLRIALLFSADHNLGPDEAQYWSWAKDLDFGYFSKPPMIAWIIAATTAVFGFRNLASKLFRRLHARGCHIPLLRRIFDQFFQDTQKGDTQLGQTCGIPPRRFFLSIPFNPNGPTAAEIYQTLALERLQRLLALRGFGRVTLCFRRAHNLRDILCRPRVDHPHRKHRPTPQTR